MLSGDVDLQTANQLRDRVDAAADEGASTVVIDLRDVEFMDSPGLGTIIYCHQRLAERQATLVLRAPQGHVRELFDIVQLGSMVAIEPES